MEIYNEQIRDLPRPESSFSKLVAPQRLNPGPETADLKVRDHPEVGAYVPGLTEAPASEVGSTFIDFHRSSSTFIVFFLFIILLFYFMVYGVQSMISGGI